MKAFSRFTAITLSIAMIIASMFTVGVFADAVTFTDVAADHQYNKAIYELVSKGIINGYTEADGTSTFKPDNTITRAEFAKLLVLATTNGVTLTATTNKFPDVAADHWANTYIAAAVGTGAINGYEDGSFRPENPVSYGEAIKMIVCTIGYANIVTPTEPWYDGYITVANRIGLTKGAAGLGINEAKRGLVAQLIYNISSTKQLVQTGTDSSGRPVYREDNSNEDIEEVSGIVTGVFETTLEGISYGLNKEQIMIDDEVYYIGEYTIDRFLPYLGKSVDIEYEDGSKKTIVNFEVKKNSSITISDYDLDHIDGRTVYYYEDNNSEDLDLASDLYVVYNGRGVEQSDIDDDFIDTYLNIESGEITLINNDSKSDYDVAFVTSYQTFFVTSKQSNTTTNSVKVFDTYGPVREIELKESDCTIYRVATKGGAKTKVDSLSSISTNSVISVAVPLDQTDGTEVVISAVKLSNAQVKSISKYDITIGNEDYVLSDYYSYLIDTDSSKYDFSTGDSGTFYLDFLGKIVYYSKSETNDPYGYLVTVESSSGLNSSYSATVFTQSGSMQEYPMDSKVKVNGNSCTPSEAIDVLEDTAAIINAPKIDNNMDEVVENADVAQLIKYKTKTSDGKTYISEIFTINANPDNLENGNIVPGKFKASAGDDADYFSKGEKLKYASSSKVFKNSADANEFTINTSTIVFLVPYDRADTDEYKKRTYSTFSNDVRYMVEPYEMSSTTAKVVIAYVGADDVNTTIEVGAKPWFVESISTTTKDGQTVEKLVYYNAGSESTSEAYTDEKTSLISEGIEPGDVIRVALENGEICGIQKLFVGGELYDWSGANVFETSVDEDNVITHAANSISDYYQVVYGSVYSKTDENDQMTVVPLDGTDWMPYTVNSSTKFYKWDSEDDVFVTTTADEILTEEKTSAEQATKVVSIKMNTSLIAVYIIE